MELEILIALSIVVIIVVIALAVIAHNMMLLINELNKRLICIVTDILQSIDLSTPHLESLSPEEKINVEDLIGEESGNYFNPHEYDVEETEDFS